MKTAKTAVVLTTINPYNKVMEAINNGCKPHSWDFIIAGDTLTPDIKADGIQYLSIADQLNSGLDYAKRAPVRNYCRKNIAYLQAIKNGADRIIETDDDNFPLETFFEPVADRTTAKVAKEDGFVNVCRYFTDKTDKIWPRGFSLADIKKPMTPYDDLSSAEVFCPIQNGMVDNDPDVDAIFRLIFDLPFDFEHKGRKVALKKGSWCSFNTQNTTFYKEYFPLMYQPATPMFRETDILRSFIIQRILWENDANMLFYSSTVFQDRNVHDYILDLREEVRLYGYVREVCTKLEDLDIKSGASNFLENMRKCYQVYKNYGLITDVEFRLLDSWARDFGL